MDRKYKEYDPFIMAHNVRQVYYVPYPSIQPRKRGWYVAIKYNPIGHIETGDVIEDVAFQDDDISPANGDIEIEEIATLCDTTVEGQQVDTTILLTPVEEEHEESGESEDYNNISDEDSEDEHE